MRMTTVSTRTTTNVIRPQYTGPVLVNGEK
jgi:hypothetical protein